MFRLLSANGNVCRMQYGTEKERGKVMPVAEKAYGKPRECVENAGRDTGIYISATDCALKTNALNRD